MGVIVEDRYVEDKQKRLFGKLMKDACWKRSRIVEGRDPERFRKDSAGNIVCRALTGCYGTLCYEYDHIIPYSNGGETTEDNCQILQTRVNRIKSDKQNVGLDAFSAKYEYTHEELDLIEMSIYGDVRRSIPGPVPTIASSHLFCRCKSEMDVKKYQHFPSCKTPNYEKSTKVS